MAKQIPFYGFNEVEISYTDLVKMAFDINTPEPLAKHYQRVLNNAKEGIEAMQLEWYRYIFLQNPDTGKIRIWVD